ncbi:hypothetical protein MKX08_002328, partial [Trichoderma sp. CBMAI-0020]
MASQRLDPISHGLFPELEPFNPDPELVNHVWAEVLAIYKNSNCPIDTATDELVKTEKANVESAKLEAERSRKEFIEILQAWDKEHDRNVGKGVKRSRTLLKNKIDLTTKVRSDILDKRSCKEVFDEMGEAKEAYDNPTGLKAVQKWFRKTADKSSFVEPFVDFIPTSDFSSVVCGGIKLILKQLERLDRDEVAKLSPGSCRADKNEDRQAVLAEIGVALADYDTLKPCINSLNWVESTGCVARAETACLERGEDLVSLTTPEDNIVTWLETLAEYASLYFHEQSRPETSQGPEVYISLPSPIRRAVQIILVPLFTLLLLTPVVICNFVSDLTARLVVVILSTTGFIAALSCLTSIRPVVLISWRN